MRRRLESRRLLREKHCRLGAVEAVDATRGVDCQIRNSLEPHNRTAILGSNRPYVQIRVRMVRRSAILQTGAPKHGSTRW